MLTRAKMSFAQRRDLYLNLTHGFVSTVCAKTTSFSQMAASVYCTFQFSLVMFRCSRFRGCNYFISVHRDCSIIDIYI